MKNKNVLVTGILVAAGIVIFIALIIWYVARPEPVLLQGEVEVKSVKVSSKLTGRVDSLFVKAGQSVRRGELLFVMSTPEVRAKLDQANAVRQAAAAQDAKANTGARPEEIAAVYNVWQAAEAAHELAEKTYARIRNLYDAGVVPAQKLDEAWAALQATKSAAQSAQEQYKVVRDGARREDKASAAALVAQATGAVSEVESYIADSHQYAPFDGEVSSVIAEQGELISSGYPIITLLDFSDMWITFNIKEDLLPKIKMGTVFEAHVTALDKSVRLKVDYMGVQADYATWSATKTRGDFDVRTFEVRATPESPVEGLRPGMTVIVNWNEI